MDAMRHLTYRNLDCAIHYWYRKGSEDKWVLFFHGAGVDHRMFEPQFALFDSTYHVVAWDARGHGLSKLPPAADFRFGDMVGDCLALYRIHSIARATLIGQSMGGNLSQEIAYGSAELVQSMVLIDCTNNVGRLTFAEKLSLKSSRLIFACYPWQTLIRQSANACADKPEVREYILQCFRRLKKRYSLRSCAVWSLAACIRTNRTAFPGRFCCFAGWTTGWEISGKRRSNGQRTTQTAPCA